MMGQLLKVLLSYRAMGWGRELCHVSLHECIYACLCVSCMHAAVTLIQIEAVSSPIAI